MRSPGRSLKQAAKQVVGACIRLSPAVQRTFARSLKIFLYHDVTDTPSPFAQEFGLAVPTAMFAEQVAWISRNFQVIHPRALCEGGPLPDNAALITFDDGFHGTFANGLALLETLRVPSIVFLNMQAVVERRPILSAIACYQQRNLPEFVAFAKREGITRPLHLSCTPEILQRLDHRFGPPDLAAVRTYQGAFADLDVVRRFAGSNVAVFGNHLYEHWNAAAISPAFFVEQYRRNREELSQFGNSAEMFAFPNGLPGRCYSEVHVELLAGLGARKVFAAIGGINREPHEFLLGRMSVNARDSDQDILWCRLLRAALSGRLGLQ